MFYSDFYVVELFKAIKASFTNSIGLFPSANGSSY